MDAIDYEEIRQLLGRYNLAIDLGDAAGWAATFAPEGVFRCTGVPEGHPLGGTVTGTDALIAYAETSYRITTRSGPPLERQHGHRGRRRDGHDALLMLNLTAGSGKVAGTTGIYEDRLRKVDGAWRFVERHIAVDTVPG